LFLTQLTIPNQKKPEEPELKEIDHAAGAAPPFAPLANNGFFMLSLVADKAMEIFDRNGDGLVSLVSNCILFVAHVDCAWLCVLESLIFNLFTHDAPLGQVDTIEFFEVVKRSNNKGKMVRLVIILAHRPIANYSPLPSRASLG